MEQKSDNNFEILSPAGDFDSLKAAVACGASSVYLGLKDFNARNKAANFSFEELRLALLYCHERNVRVYLTMNTLLKDFELNDAFKLSSDAINLGIDGIIIQDLSLYFMLKRAFPDFPFHASTQMGIHNALGAAYAEKIGFDRVVLARETLTEDIKEIKNSSNVELECFIHGAHCVSFSGNCYYSSLVSGYSGNRGKCMQLCRKKYVLSGEGKTKKGYELSLKDICLINNLDVIRDAGVVCGKIEGRLRSREYSGIATSCYRKSVNKTLTNKDLDKLKVVFNRGNYSTGYVLDAKPDLIYDASQNNIGLKVGSTLNANTDFPSVSFRSSIVLHNGDGVKVMRNGKEIAGGTVVKPDRVKLDRVIKETVDVYLTKSTGILGEIDGRIKASVKTGVPYEPIRSKNRVIPDKLVENRYVLPEKCVALTCDEFTSGRVVQKADLLIYSPCDYSLSVAESFVSNNNGKEILLDLPIEARGEDIKVLERLVDSGLFNGFVANNVYALELCKDHKVLLGSGMNLMNNYFNESAVTSIESAENKSNRLLYAFGKTVLMNLTHCPRRTLGFSCSGCRNPANYCIIDESGYKMRLRRIKLHYCYWQLINSKVQNLSSKLGQSRSSRILVDARNVDEDRTLKFMDNPLEYPFDSSSDTLGRFGRGVK